MVLVMKCSQINCFALATHRFTWPGSPEQPSCYHHALVAERLATAMSFDLKVLPECLLCASTATVFRDGTAYCADHVPDAEPDGPPHSWKP